MGNKIYVGNLSFNATEESIRSVFSQFGNVDSCKIITDRDTGRSKGFCFVEMGTSNEAQDAIAELDGKEFEGRPLKVNEAKPQERNGGGQRRSNRW